MVDNVQVTQGSGPQVASDECIINGVTAQVQRIKSGFGTDGNYTDPSITNPFPTMNPDIGGVADPVYSGSGNMSLVAGIKKLIAQFAAGFTMSGSVAMADSEGVKGQIGGITTNPTSTFTRPADIIPYSINDFIANIITAGSVNIPALSLARVALGSFQIDRLRLTTNHTTGLSGISVRVRLWTAQPTYVNGDNGTYAIATGAAGYLGSFTGAFEQFADGATSLLLPDAGSPCVDLTSGQVGFWDIQTLAAFTPQSGKTFTLIPEVKQD